MALRYDLPGTLNTGVVFSKDRTGTHVQGYYDEYRQDYLLSHLKASQI